MRCLKTTFFKLAIIFIIVTWFGTAFADPSISSVSSELIHKSTITIRGDDFGSKSPAAPLLWQDCEDKTVNNPSAAASDFITVAPPESQDYSPTKEYALQYRTSWADMPQAHARSTKYLAGGHSPNCAGGGCNIVCATTDSGGPQNTWVMMWYLRLHEDWLNVGPGRLSNYKEIWLNNGAGYNGGSAYNVLYFSKDSDWPYNGSNPGGIDTNIALCGIQFESDQASPVIDWRHREVILNKTPGFVSYRSDNGGSTWTGNEITCSNLGVSGDWQSLSIGSFARFEDTSECPNCTHTGMKRYFDDIYLDNTFSRVILTNNANYSQSTIREPQPPTTWASNSINVQVNLGKLPESGTAYLFVFDSNNIPNPTGYLVSIGGGGSTGIPPTAPENVHVEN